MNLYGNHIYYFIISRGSEAEMPSNEPVRAMCVSGSSY
jgi:hypothetical protein